MLLQSVINRSWFFFLLCCPVRRLFVSERSSQIQKKKNTSLVFCFIVIKMSPYGLQAWGDNRDRDPNTSTRDFMQLLFVHCVLSPPWQLSTRDTEDLAQLYLNYINVNLSVNSSNIMECNFLCTFCEQGLAIITDKNFKQLFAENGITLDS